jgi:hypothetical protein
MTSHACGSCGKMLDSASRSYSGDLRMWIARCCRCGLAVRWSPREARSPARIWARLRTLNLRLGVAFTLGQSAGIVLFITMALLWDGMLVPFEGDLVDALASPWTALLLLVATLSGVSGAVLAPEKPALMRALGAWLICVSPVALALAGLFAPAVAFHLVRLGLPFGRIDIFDSDTPAAALLMSVIVSAVLSIPLAALGGVLIGPIVQTATRRRAREIRATAPRRTAR